MLIKDCPNTDRPRERLREVGVNALSNRELIAIILQTGTKNSSVLDLADNILKQVNNISELKQLTIEELCSIKGIKESKALKLIAAIEFGKRVITCTEVKEVITFNNPNVIFEYFRYHYLSVKQEIFMCAYLNGHKELITTQELFRGSIDNVTIHPREIFLAAYKHHAAFIVLIHNHPSLNVSPSKNDIDVTHRIVEIGKLMGIGVIDHLIITDRDYFSFKQHGYIKVLNELF